MLSLNTHCLDPRHPHSPHTQHLSPLPHLLCALLASCGCVMEATPGRVSIFCYSSSSFPGHVAGHTPLPSAAAPKSLVWSEGRRLHTNGSENRMSLRPTSAVRTVRRKHQACSGTWQPKYKQTCCWWLSGISACFTCRYMRCDIMRSGGGKYRFGRLCFSSLRWVNGGHLLSVAAPTVTLLAVICHWCPLGHGWFVYGSRPHS